MSQHQAFITSQYRPEIIGAKLDKTHVTRFYYDPIDKHDRNNSNKLLEINALCFGPKKDIVILELEHAVTEKDKVLIVYYEDMHKRWSYIISNNQAVFIYRKNAAEQYYIKPKNLYIRGCSIEPESEYWSVMGNFLNFVELWPGNIICANRQQSQNESKLFQLSNSLTQARSKKHNLSIGHSYVIKGNRIANKFFTDNSSYIVKSLSAVRSQVVDSEVYDNWDVNNLNNLPTLFQQKISGQDLRVHIVDNNCYAKLSLQKATVDYRYGDDFFNLIDYEDLPGEVISFCQQVSRLECNNLMGIDFLKADNSYVVLEANPCPGWASYYSDRGKVPSEFVNQIIELLKA